LVGEDEEEEKVFFCLLFRRHVCFFSWSGHDGIQTFTKEFVFINMTSITEQR
jgi:hypothetical protein